MADTELASIAADTSPELTDVIYGVDSGGTTDKKFALEDVLTLLGSGSVATDAIFDAKGDLPAGTGANTSAKLTVGSDGQLAHAHAAASTGLIYRYNPVRLPGASFVTINPGGGATAAVVQPGLVRMGGSDAALVVTADRTYYWPIFVAAPLAVDALVFAVGSADASNARAALITAADTWQPAASGLLEDTGDVSTASTGTKTTTFTSRTLAPGPYLLSFRSAGTPTLKGAAVAWPSGVIGGTAGLAYDHLTSLYVGETSGAYNASPTAWTVAAGGASYTTNAYCPIYLRVAA